MENFAVIGAAGYIAPKHLKAIRDTGNRIIAVLDPHDSVGLLDQYGYDIKYFSDQDRFERFLQKLRCTHDEDRVHWVSICSPNYLHDSHCRLAMDTGADVICEKPLVISPWNLGILKSIEERTGHNVFTVLQLRHHPELLKIKAQLALGPANQTHRVNLRYITPRGRWYDTSWKGNVEKSGGLITNIGVHLLDMLIWMFGDIENIKIYVKGDRRLSGQFIMRDAVVNWFLSIDKDDLSDEEEEICKPVRVLEIDGIPCNFADGFTDLHTNVYKEILRGCGYGIDDARPAIELAHRVRKYLEEES